MIKMIKLPNLSWFMGMLNFRGEGNIYTGSAGCDPALGNSASKTFRYRVWIEKIDDGYTLTAVYYYGLYSYDATDRQIMQQQQFEASENGIKEAESWIQEAENAALNKFRQSSD